MTSMKERIKPAGPFMELIWAACFAAAAIWLPVALCGEALADGLAINEFMAANETTATDEEGKYEDWIELYNNSSSAISLTGYYLSDKTDNPGKWAFPEESAIAAGGYLIVWADEDLDDGEMHADFKLSDDGEDIVLSILNGTEYVVVDQVNFGAQTDDISTGRYPNGTGDFVAMNPTFAAENTPGIGLMGDVDGDAFVGLSDAVASMQVTTNNAEGLTVYLTADVNSDGKIGLPEALYAMREASPARTDW